MPYIPEGHIDEAALLASLEAQRTTVEVSIAILSGKKEVLDQLIADLRAGRWHVEDDR